MKVLVAYDGSENSKRAVEYAAKMAKICSDMKVTVISVAYIPDHTFYNEFIPHNVKLSEEFRKKAREHLKDAEAIFNAAGIEVETVTETGDTADIIINTVKDQGFDQVIMGTRGLSNLQGLFLGSVSSKVIATLEVPVTVVK
ncbi:universal stress protein [Desulfofalx alkaliphila]|uniref:universal stress protein n=1 Tax=Desulfofalx alkaliphila TaxID=105483 RepID=UPI0004E1358A|nr:universal stress protein [Desulfofalx alkaliphila]